LNQVKFIILIAITLYAIGDCHSQDLITGRVIDGKTREPLAFVHILFDGAAHSGTITDIDGKFLYKPTVRTLTCSYVGYEKTIIEPDSLLHNGQVTIELKALAFQLQEVEINADENPANRIIRKVIEYKKINNPENISSFKYTSYNKVIYDFHPTDTQDPDSIQQKMNEKLKGGHLLIMESVTERKFIQPDRNNETIIGTKVSGFKNPSFGPLATDLQPFSFYNDIINILDIDYLNPISNGSLKKYHFNIEDTLFQRQDTTFILSFEPQANKNFEGLAGLLYINTNKYAIQNVIAEPAEKGFIDIKIQQRYQLVDSLQWFPEQLNFEIVIRQYPSKKMGMSMNGRSYIEGIELFPDLDKKAFPLESIAIHEFADEKDDLFWNKHRAESLSERELTTYQVLDSLGEAHKFDAILKFFEKAAFGKIPIKFMDIDLSKTLVSNKFEGLRLGFGAYSNEKLLKFLSLGGFFGYGLKDHQWKYGGELILTLNKYRELEIRGSHQNTLTESGKTGLNFFNKSYDFRSFLAAQMDRIEQTSFSLGFRTIKYAQLNFSLSHVSVTPQYIYEYQTSDQPNITDYTYSDLGIKLRYAFREKLISSMNQRVSMGTKYPVLYLNYSRGINDFYGSQLDFNKIEARIEKSFPIINLGETNIRVDGGFIDGAIPYGLLFTGEGSFDKDLPILMKNYFQTVTPYEFLSDQYVNVHFSHNFGSLLFQVKKFKPHLTFHQNMGWGTLSTPQNHTLIDFKTKEKGLYESGLQIDNILKLNYVNLAYLGFGAGLYYRYGSYSYDNAADNLAVKFSMTFTTK